MNKNVWGSNNYKKYSNSKWEILENNEEKYYGGHYI